MRTQVSQTDHADAPLRALPPVHRLLADAERAGLLALHPHEAVASALRDALTEARAAIRAGAAVPDPETLLDGAARHLAHDAQPGRRVVINATGIALHTNLGRAPLAAEAVDAMRDAAGYVDLEYDIETGERGRRIGAIESLLRNLLGCEAAIVVNNCAAAVLLALSAHAAGGEVVVSRGELVEIGGGFRVPDIIASGGARLVEVGTTNRTRPEDYARAIGPATRMLLKVHRSNFRLTGFTEEASLDALDSLAHAHGLLLMEDLGSGALANLAQLSPGGRLNEPTVADAVRFCDLVAFSGDKLLGGPQAGLVVGTEAAIAPLRRHPLMRAVRLDKVTLAALDATLRLYRDPARTIVSVPVLRMLAQTEQTLQARAEQLRALLTAIPSAAVEIRHTAAEAGGGTLPGETIPSRALAIAIPHLTPDALARALRLRRPSIVGRIADGQVLLDLFAVSDDQLPAIVTAVADLAGSVP